MQVAVFVGLLLLHVFNDELQREREGQKVEFKKKLLLFFCNTEGSAIPPYQCVTTRKTPGTISNHYEVDNEKLLLVFIALTTHCLGYTKVRNAVTRILSMVPQRQQKEGMSPEIITGL